MRRKVAVITGTGKVEVQTQELPELQENEALIKVKASLISPGTEMGLVREYIANPDSEREVVPFGYSCAGVIKEVNGTCSGLCPGMRVFAMGAGKALHADLVHVPVNLIVPLPDELPFEEAVYACLGATALHALRRGAPTLGEYGVILGMGIVGNLAMQLAKLMGARVVAWEGLEGRRKIASACRLEEVYDVFSGDMVEQTRNFAAPYGFDFAVFAFGGDGTAAFKQVLDCMKESADGHRMGRVIMVGGCNIDFTGAAAGGNIDILSAARTGPGYHDPAWEHGADYPAAFIPFTTSRNLREILNLITEKRLLVSPMTTHTMRLEQIEEAARLLVRDPGKAMGIVLKMN